MTNAPTCTGPDCARPAPDAYLCTSCTRTLEKILAELPATLTDLQTTITRQARTSRSGGGKPTKASESPLPFDVHASNLADRVRNGLSTWIRHLVESRGVESTEGPTHPPGGCQHDSCRMIRNRAPVIERTEDMALWLVQYVETIRQDEAAGELLTQLKGIQSELRAAVDNREYRYAGPCTAVLQPTELATDITGDGSRIVVKMRTEPAGPPEVCGADLRIREGSKTIVCRECEAEYELSERMVTVLAKIRGEMATGRDAADLLSGALGQRVTWASIRKMEHSGHISYVTTDDLDRKLYLIGDVLDVVVRRLKLSLPNTRITA